MTCLDCEEARNETEYTNDGTRMYTRHAVRHQYLHNLRWPINSLLIHVLTVELTRSGVDNIFFISRRSRDTSIEYPHLETVCLYYAAFYVATWYSDTRLLNAVTPVFLIIFAYLGSGESDSDKPFEPLSWPIIVNAVGAAINLFIFTRNLYRIFRHVNRKPYNDVDVDKANHDGNSSLMTLTTAAAWKIRAILLFTVLANLTLGKFAFYLLESRCPIAVNPVTYALGIIPVQIWIGLWMGTCLERYLEDPVEKMARSERRSEEYRVEREWKKEWFRLKEEERKRKAEEEMGAWAEKQVDVKSLGR